MGFSDEDIRASHTIRIFGTNEAGELLHDIWLDVERIDVYRVTTQHAGHFQGLYRRLYWMDDPAADDYSESGNPARTEGLKKFCSPDEEDQQNPAVWVPVRTIIEMSFNESTDYQQRGGRRGNRTSADNQVRIVAARRCFHHDTTIDAAAQAAADSGQKAFVMPSNLYDFVEGSEDKDNYIEVQYVSSTLQQSSAKADEGKNQMVQTNWKNIHYLNFTDEAKGPVNPEHGFDPPWALDPFQAVVNVNWKQQQQWLLGRHGPQQIGFAIWPEPLKAEAKDTAESVKMNVTNGASGLGFTVLTAGCIAFGTVKDGSSSRACFMRSAKLVARDLPHPPCPVYASTVVDGELHWNLVWTAPGPVIALSYANDAFFITYASADFARSRLAVIRDINDVVSNINPFPSTLNTNGESSEWSGNVAYNKASEKYACAGAHFKFTPTDPDRFAANNLFCWSSSSDGLTWSDGMTDNFYSGIGMQSADERTTICAGNGIFVAAAGKKHSFLQFPGLGRPDLRVLHSSAVAVSINGASWTQVPLPGALIGDAGGSSTTSDTSAVAFITDRAFADPVTGRTGYFVAADIGSSNLDNRATTTSMLWTSPDGHEWTRLPAYDYSIVGLPPTFIPTDPIFSYWSLSAIAKKLSTSKIVVVTD